MCIIIISHVAHTWKREYLVKTFAACALSFSRIAFDELSWSYFTTDLSPQQFQPSFSR